MINQLLVASFHFGPPWITQFNQESEFVRSEEHKCKAPEHSPSCPHNVIVWSLVTRVALCRKHTKHYEMFVFASCPLFATRSLSPLSLCLCYMSLRAIMTPSPDVAARRSSLSLHHPFAQCTGTGNETLIIVIVFLNNFPLGAIFRVCLSVGVESSLFRVDAPRSIHRTWLSPHDKNGDVEEARARLLFCICVQSRFLCIV